MRATLWELINQLANTTNPVTTWSIRMCIIDRLKNKDLDLSDMPKNKLDI